MLSGYGIHWTGARQISDSSIAVDDTPPPLLTFEYGSGLREYMLSLENSRKSIVVL
jgi:hypothetical protein